MICGRWPLRAWKMIELGLRAWLLAEQPQCVSRAKLKFRRRNQPHNRAAAASATITKETAVCQFTPQHTRECAAGKCDFQSAFSRLNLAARSAYAPRMVSHEFHHSYRVVYADCTLGDHVYHARYLDVLEAARGEFFRQLGSTFRNWQEQDVIFPVVEARLRYKSPARYDDVLQTAVWVTLAERVRLNFGYRILNQDAALTLEAETLHVCTGRDGTKPKRLPAALLTALKPHFRAVG